MRAFDGRMLAGGKWGFSLQAFIEITQRVLAYALVYKGWTRPALPNHISLFKLSQHRTKAVHIDMSHMSIIRAPFSACGDCHISNESCPVTPTTKSTQKCFFRPCRCGVALFLQYFGC